MESLKAHKKRNATFRKHEEKILVSLVKKYRYIVENKKTDAITNKEKTKAWENFAKQYTSLTGDFKESSCLRTRFNNLKKVSKKKFAEEQKYIKGTGGGPKIEVHITDTENEIREILGDTLTGFQSEFDNDRALEIINKENENPEESVYKQSEVDNCEESIEENIIIGIDSEQSINVRSDIDDGPESSSPTKEGGTEAEGRSKRSNHVAENNFDDAEEDWTDYNPRKLRLQKSDKLRVRQSDTAKTLQNKICTWAISKNEIAALQKTAFSEEQQLKLQQMREKHELFLKIQSEEWNLKRMHMIEEHNMKMLCLKKSLTLLPIKFLYSFG